ncbi:hypothetical protein GDO86_019888 [Hymenochirus boettgeri]|uniref:Kelch domain containing 3 n=1 Tax=Hymenochirus boettgeri TaxID=247094 RepID=A0A8T2IMR2_9PIPI|nr:hypothetical protein GDO86_019888 [Hymenochirus boettgeri]
MRLAVAYRGELYVFGGYNARLNRHFQDLWKYTPVFHYFRPHLESGGWQRVDVQGKGPCARRRQCCCTVGDKILLFGGTSPSQDQDPQDEFYLMDHSDLYILDFSKWSFPLCIHITCTCRTVFAITRCLAYCESHLFAKHCLGPVCFVEPGCVCLGALYTPVTV